LICRSTAAVRKQYLPPPHSKMHWTQLYPRPITPNQWL